MKLDDEQALSFGHMLEDKGFSEEQIDEFLEHFGVKGMKWGVRRQNRLARAERVAEGTASRGERVRFALTDTSSMAVGRAGGLRGAAASRAQELRNRRDRIERGEARVRDLLALYGADRLMILGRENPAA